MRHKRILSLALAVALLMGCVGFAPARAELAESAQAVQITQDAPSTQMQAPQFVDPEQFAQSEHIERLHHDERLDTYVYRNRDGTKSVYYMGQNVKYEDENGNIRDKDTTLVRADRGYRMRDNDVELHLPDSPADGITLGHGSRSVRLLPQGGSGSASLQSNSITYPGYFGAETALRYTPLLSGVKEDIILSSYTGQNSFSFVLETGGLFLYERDGQYYLAENETAEAAFYLGQVVVYDAMGRPDDGSMAVEILTPGQEYRLTLSADVDYLTDPETVYPVTIDPSLTVGYIVQGVNAIVDAPIYEGKPNSNYANYYYNRVGYYDDEYMTARTVMRLDALLSSTEWQSIDEEDITSLTLYIKESSGKSAKQVNIHALTENSTWTESTVKWSNVGAYSSTVYASATLGNDAWSEFDLTSLARNWKTGTESAQCGFLLKLADESVYRTFYSCEYSTIDYRPYIVLEYAEKLTMSHSTAAINEGGSLTLTATTQFGTPDDLTWTSSDSDVATVAGGAVTARKAGVATITATCTDADGITLSATCRVYVKIPDGTYYIANAGSGLCLANYDSTVDSNSVYITNKNTTTVTQPTQFWQITYMGSGWYAIRPVDRILAVMTMDNSKNVVVTDLAENSTVQISNRWKIIQESTGYVFLHKGLSSNAMTTTGLSEGTNVTLAPKTSNSSCHWMLDEAIGLFLRDTATQRAIPTAITKTVDLGQTYTLADLGLRYEFYGSRASTAWSSNSSGDYDIVSVDTSGTVTPNYGGVSTITLTVSTVDSDFSVSFTLISILPLSGYELDYEPDLWNYNNLINDRANCYAYALNVQINPDTGCGWKMQPGEASGHGKFFTRDQMLPYIITTNAYDDSVVLGFVFSEIDKDAVCDPGCYKVALVIDLYTDYHWYRQNPDGTWSHKPGMYYVTNRDSEGNLIYDPSIAYKDYTDLQMGDYIDYICYFQVSPLNYLYSETSALSTAAQDANSALNDQSTSKVKSKNCFDSSTSEVVLLLEESDLTFNDGH